MQNRNNRTLLDQLTPKQRMYLAVALLAVFGIVALVQWLQRQPAPQPQPGQTLANRNVRFGMPADAKADPASPNAYLIERDQYVLSYNNSKRIPNWVCWNVTKSDIGETERDTSFEPDPLLPKSFRAIKTSDYDKSGFDRGHMCPSKDRSDTPENNNITFYMTNIVPQSAECNQRAWGRLEHDCRKLAEAGSELYIACGPHGQGGEGRFGPRETIGPEITVPNAVWKVVLILPNKDAAPTADARAIAVWMPNDKTVTANWKKHLVTVAEVEQRTGFKFFPLVPDEVASPIKNRVYEAP